MRDPMEPMSVDRGTRPISGLALAFTAWLALMSPHTGLAEERAHLFETQAPLALVPGTGYLVLMFELDEQVRSVRFSPKGDRTVVFMHSQVDPGRSLYLWRVPAGEYCLERYYSGKFVFEPNSSHMLCFPVRADAVNYPGSLYFAWGGVTGLQIKPYVMERMLESGHPALLSTELPWVIGRNELTSLDEVRRLAAVSGARETADNYRKGTQGARDAKRAFDNYLSAARAGDGRAAALVCQQLDRGEGVPEDPSAAVPWCRTAVERNDILGAWLLARLHARGRGGLAPDQAEQERLIRLAGAPGQLANLVLNDSWVTWSKTGPRIDGAELVRLAEAWAEAGSNRGSVAAGRAHAEGWDGSPDGERAVVYYLQAVERGDGESLFRIASLYWNGTVLARDERKAVEFMLRRAEEHTGALNGAAWFLATAADPKLRDGKRAIKFAKQAIRARGADAARVDTLAAAYAAAGNYKRAIAEQRTAIDLAVAEEWSAPALEVMRGRLSRYENGEPAIHQ